MKWYKKAFHIKHFTELTRRVSWIKGDQKLKPVDELEINKERLMQVAQEVLAGKRPESDLEKYGIELEDVATGEEAKRMLLAELAEDEED